MAKLVAELERQLCAESAESEPHAAAEIGMVSPDFRSQTIRPPCAAFVFRRLSGRSIRLARRRVQMRGVVALRARADCGELPVLH